MFVSFADTNGLTILKLTLKISETFDKKADS